MLAPLSRHWTAARHAWADIDVPLLIFLTCFTVYLLIGAGHNFSIDGVVMFQYAKALVFQQSFIMDPPIYWGQVMQTSKWPIGLTLVYMPVLYLLSVTLFRGNPDISQIPYDPNNPYNGALFVNAPYYYSSFVNPLITAFIVVLVYKIAEHLGFSRRKSAAAAFLFGLLSPAAVFTRFDFAQPLAAFFVALTVLLFMKARTHRSLALLFWAGLVLGIGVLARPELAVIPALPLAVLALLIWPVERKPLKLPWLPQIINAVVFGLPVAVFLFLNQGINSLRFGGLLSVGYNPASEFNLAVPHILTAIAGNLFSPGRGIFLFFPFSFLAVVGAVKVFRRDRFLGALFLSVTAGFVLFYSTWNDWGGGITWGPRFLIPAVPFISLLAVMAFDQYNALKITIVAVLAILSLVVVVQGILFNFIVFYQGLALTGGEVVDGSYHFRMASSPTLFGWDTLSDPNTYDVAFIQKRNEFKKFQVGMILIFFTGVFASYWTSFFRKKDCDIPA